MKFSLFLKGEMIGNNLIYNVMLRLHKAVNFELLFLLDRLTAKANAN